jgi:hypothetical protein
MEDSDIQAISSALVGVVQKVFKETCNVTFNGDPEIAQRDIIEYQSRMRVSGIEKLPEACYVVAVSFYTSEENLKKQVSCGALALYIEEELSERIMSGLGKSDFDDDDYDVMLDGCAEFMTKLAESFKTSLAPLGFSNLIISEPLKGRSNIVEGIGFPYKEYQYTEARFKLSKKEALIFDNVMTKI